MTTTRTDLREMTRETRRRAATDDDRRAAVDDATPEPRQRTSTARGPMPENGESTGRTNRKPDARGGDVRRAPSGTVCCQSARSSPVAKSTSSTTSLTECLCPSHPAGFANTVTICDGIGMPGRGFAALLDIAHDQYGYVTVADARRLGLAEATLRTLAYRGDADRVAQGLYRLTAVPDRPLDQLMEATLWPRGLGVISHDTALGELWELCDVNPAKVHVTVPARARIRRLVPPAFAVHSRDVPAADITRHNGIPVVTVRRAILDGIERHLGGHLIDQAIVAARATGQLRGADLDLLDEARADR